MSRPSRNAPIGRPLARALAAGLLLALAACGDDDADTRTRNGTDVGNGQASGLPAPEGAIGSVTGMPANPGPGTTPVTGMAGAAPNEASATPEGGDADSGLTWTEDPAIDGVFVLTDDPAATSGAATPALPIAPAPAPPAPPATPAPQSSVPRQAAVVPAAPADPSATVPAGTERATESTTFVVEPAETDGED